MGAEIQIACAACGYAAELPASEVEDPDAVLCPMCGTWIRDYAAEVAAASQSVPEPLPEPPLDLEPVTSPIPDPVSNIVGTSSNDGIGGVLVEAGTKTLKEQYPLTGTVTVVGRQDSDINFDDPTMSVHQFEIEKRAGEFFIRDLESTNQTQVNGRAITSTTLESGDRIQAGLTMLVFLAS